MVCCLAALLIQQASGGVSGTRLWENPTDTHNRGYATAWPLRAPQALRRFRSAREPPSRLSCAANWYARLVVVEQAVDEVRIAQGVAATTTTPSYNGFV